MMKKAAEIIILMTQVLSYILFHQRVRRARTYSIEHYFHVFGIFNLFTVSTDHGINRLKLKLPQKREIKWTGSEWFAW